LSAASKLGISPVAPTLAPAALSEAPAAAPPAGVSVVAAPVEPAAESVDGATLGVSEAAPLPDAAGDELEVCANDVPANASSAAAVALVINFSFMDLSPLEDIGNCAP
jgi:hypothetical protein